MIHKYIVFLIVILLTPPLFSKLPVDMSHIARQIGCKEISDFYDRSGIIYHEYINAHDGRKDQLLGKHSTFWCKSIAKKNYLLVFITNGQLGHRDGCSPKLEWKYKPNGLSIHWTKIPIKEFIGIDGGLNSKSNSKSQEETEYFPLIDVYNGHGFAFYCIDKKWFYTEID